MQSLGPSPTRLSSPKGGSNVRLHCRQTHCRSPERSIRLWQQLLKYPMRWLQEQQCSQPCWGPCRACAAVDMSGDVRIGNPAEGVWPTAVAGLIGFGSATSVTCQITSSQIACSTLPPMRLQKGTSSEHYLSPAGPTGPSPRGNQGGGNTSQDPNKLQTADGWCTLNTMVDSGVNCNFITQLCTKELGLTNTSLPPPQVSPINTN